MPPNIQNERLETRIRELENQVKQISRRGNVFSEPVVIYLDGRNLRFGSVTGSQIGETTGQLIAFHGKTPIGQAASADQAVVSLDVDVTGADTVDKAAINANFSAIQTLLNRLRLDLTNKGLIKGAA